MSPLEPKESEILCMSRLKVSACTAPSFARPHCPARWNSLRKNKVSSLLWRGGSNGNSIHGMPVTPSTLTRTSGGGRLMAAALQGLQPGGQRGKEDGAPP
mmetsp:Transcript_19295/g.53395  ORF Transcript_19295/g.53395 Transcript_19295/m.53395 type:complete len:100 (-) Transcript_19295:2-301(-)